MSARAIERFVGRRVLAWLAAGAAAGAALGLVELAVASFFLLFLESLGLHPFGDVRPALAPAPITLPVALGGLLVIATVRAVAHYLTSQASHEAQVGLDARLRRFALHRMLAPGARVVAAAEIHRRLADTFPKAASATSQACAFVAASFQALVIALLMTLASPIEASIGLLGLALVGVVVLGLHRRVRVIAERIPREQRTLYEGIERVARNFVLVRVLGETKREHARLAGAADAFAVEARGATHLISLAYAATPVFGTVLLVVILALSAFVLHTEATRLVAFLYLYVRFVQTLAGAVRTFTGVAQGWPQLREARAIVLDLDDAARAEALAPIARGRTEAEPPRGSVSAPTIELEGVRFRYTADGPDVVSGLSFRVEAGEQFAIVGPSGSGKTTVLLLVLGFLEPLAGRVRIGGGAPAEQWASGRSRVGYVGAEPYLIAGTIRENLAYGQTHVPTDERMWAVLETVRLEGVLRSRGGGLELLLDEKGGGLSAGEQQRLALARALLADPALLVLDEASANLDARLEAEIVQLVHGLRGRCTTLIVSHRPAMVAHADHVLELPAGG